MSERNNTIDKVFQFGLVLIIPAISYVYAQGANVKVLESLNKNVAELHSAVKELGSTTNQLYNTTTILSRDAQSQEARIQRLETSVNQNSMDIVAMKSKGDLR